MPDPKGEWSLKENNSELHHGIQSKVNQFINTLVCNFMPNIRILVKVVLQIFCSQGCSYTNACVWKRRVTHPKIYGIGSKVIQFIYTSVCNYLPNNRILAKAVLQIFCSQGVPKQNACVRKRGVTQPKINEICSKVNQFIYTLVCNYMPNINILTKAVLQIFCSQGCSYTKCLCPKRGVTQPKIYGIASKFNQFINTLVCNYMPNIRILAKAVLKIFFSQGCSYTKCLCPKKGNNSTKNLLNRFKS